MHQYLPLLLTYKIKKWPCNKSICLVTYKLRNKDTSVIAFISNLQNNFRSYDIFIKYENIIYLWFSETQPCRYPSQSILTMCSWCWTPRCSWGSHCPGRILILQKSNQTQIKLLLGSQLSLFSFKGNLFSRNNI